jgi:MFS family permease
MNQTTRAFSWFESYQAASPCTKTTFFVFSTHGPNCAGLLARSIRQFETWGHSRIALLVGAAAIFGFGCALAAIMPNGWLFGLALLIVGVSAQTFTISTNSLVQLSTEPVMRGRVMAILLATALGGAPIRAPIVGWVADRFGPRWALGVGAAAGLAAAMAGIYYLTKRGYLRASTLDASASFKAVGLKNPPTPFRARRRRD